jgi:hypothetical protein
MACKQKPDQCDAPNHAEEILPLDRAMAIPQIFAEIHTSTQSTLGSRFPVLIK